MSSRRARRLAGLVAAAAVFTAACGGSDSAGSDAEPAPADQPAEATSPLTFTSPLVGGGELDASTLDDKPTALWFWAPT